MKTKPSAEPPKPAETAREARRMALGRDFDLAAAIQAADDAARWLRRVRWDREFR